MVNRCSGCVKGKKRKCDYSSVLNSCHHCLRTGRRCDYKEKFNHEVRDVASSIPDFRPPMFGQRRLEDFVAMPVTIPQRPQAQIPFNDEWDQVVDGDEYIAMGVDIGTSTSAASFRRVSEAFSLSTQQYFETQRVTLNENGSHEIPTQIAFTKDNDGNPIAIHSPQAIRDNEILSGAVFKLLKLLIISDEDIECVGYQEMIQCLRRRAQRLLTKLRVDGNLPEDVKILPDLLQKTLAYIWRTIKEFLMAQSGMDEDLMDWVLRYKTRLVVATPALWTPRLNYVFLDMLKKAGFTHPMLRSEPKLVGILHAYEYEYRYSTGSEAFHRASTDKSALDGRRITFADIGGGTLDITTLEPDNPPPKSTFRSVAVGDDNLSGSTHLNHIFRVELRILLGDHLGACAKSQKCSEEEFLDMLEEGFEMAKRDFDVNKISHTRIEHKDIKNDLPAPDKDIDELIFSGKDLRASPSFMQRVFNKYLEDIIKLIEAQLARLPAKTIEGKSSGDENKPHTNEGETTTAKVNQKRDIIMLDGGGSLIRYIQKRIQNHFTDHIVVPKADRNRSSVAHGGVIAAIHPEVGTRLRSRGGYGMVHVAPWLKKLAWHKGLYHLTEPADEGTSYHSGRQLRNCYQPILEHGDAVDGSYVFMYEGMLDITADDDVVLYADIHHVHDKEWAAAEKGWVVNREETATATRIAQVGMKLTKDMLNIRWRKGRTTTIHYRVVPRFEGVFAKWYMIVPRSGSFGPEFMDDMWLTEDCYVAEAITPDFGVRQEYEKGDVEMTE